MEENKPYIDRGLNLIRLKTLPKLFEMKKKEILNGLFESVKNDFNTPKFFVDTDDYMNKEDVEYVPRAIVYPDKVNEDQTYVPRFQANNKFHKIFAEFPVNKPIKFSRELMTKAIQYGMIILIQYRGDKDEFVQGHSRVIYPMVLGWSGKGKMLLRGYHLKGWSVSKRGNIDKEWRMFRSERILSMSFTGSFFRLPPEGYNMNDKGMRGGLIVSANFGRIRKNQQALLMNNVVQNKKEIDMNANTSIVVDPTGSMLNLLKPFDNINLAEEDKNILRLTFLKSNIGNHYIAVLGALGRKGNTVKMFSRGKQIGTYRVLKSIMGDNLGREGYKWIEGKNEFELFIFIEKK
jgi:hypothetical protein